ncbi:hypothetical protein SAMN05444141_101920 [Pseudovibrio denitrificans]|uniref:Uncharacterized protein n=1 Tax=Pseudovibrio denitrificans TaxID=258256 RepID=A0A1I6YJW2_9HYPH|nr:hypothetical protein [Pseudovibrio denitrificans]SFT50608.1 hypothetical protein SAMN05444141_101920 [Pseudovibrio denitrificans]
MYNERNLTPIEIWLGLHTELQNWSLKFAEEETSPHPLRDPTNKTYLQILRKFPAKNWSMIGDGAGWTPVAAMALSWCKDASWEATLKAWQSIENLDLGSPVAKLSAQMTNPQFLPEPDLAQILKLGRSPGGAWVLLSALKLHGSIVEFKETRIMRSSVNPILWPLIKDGDKPNP